MNLMLFLMLAFLPSQQPKIEYGQPGELKGVTKIYIDAGLDLDARNTMFKEISKELKSIVVTEQPEDAEVVLAYGESTEKYLWDVSTNTNPSSNGGTRSTSTPNYRKMTVGSGMVMKNAANNRIRLLMKFDDTKKGFLERDPSKNFARAFVKAYKDANKEHQ
jgi:hypothetical protein